MSDLDVVDWFAIRVRFNRAGIAAKERFNKPDIEVYLPMEIKSVATKCKGVCVKPVPIFSNLLFVKTSFQRVSEFCTVHKDMYYQSETVNGYKRAIRIPENQMTTFKEFIAENYDNIDCKITKLKSGKKVVIKSGLFKGTMAEFKEEKGKINKKYIIAIDGADYNFSDNSLSEHILSKI